MATKNFAITVGATTREVEYTAADFAAVLDYLKARGIAVVTVAEGMAQLGKNTDADPKKWIYGDGFGNDIEDWSWGKKDIHQAAVVRDGKAAIAFEPDNWGGVAFHSLAGGFDAASWPTLELWVHGGATGGQKVQISFLNGQTRIASIPFDQALGSAVKGNAWQKVTLALPAGTITDIVVEDISGADQPVMYLDSIVLRKPPPVAPALVIYDEGLRSGFSDRSWGKHELGQTGVVHSGIRGMSFQTDRFGGLALHHDGVDARAYASLELWLNGGKTGGQHVVIGVWDGARLRYVDLTAVLGGTLRENTWQRARVPIASLTTSGMVRDLFIVSLDEKHDGKTVYVDDVRLVP